MWVYKSNYDLRLKFFNFFTTKEIKELIEIKAYSKVKKS